ncbi:GH92 family glycosyl hydrolase [Dyadobacter sp. CY261]|uniref:GH92 family glycosyl hydrolase n=1 Tax=Dyadobacter sp. CY261 TaxID=2907203 RepID=UPI001F44B875|nr:GH92 family glycosyl hydrolase [Dyadobacter sp. CY261]MCF0070614.1 GH92 family glycosyl hydrolase [Dyadobacter sp. CY261]
MILPFKKLSTSSFILVFFFLSLTSRAQKNPEKDNLQYVDLRIGNVGQLLEPTRPTVQLPNQMMRMFPVRQDYLDDQISSFPAIIVSHRLGQAFALRPSVQPVSVGAWKQKMAYDHDLEILRPYFYSTYLIDDEVKVDFVPGNKVGIYRFEYPKNGRKSILFDLYNNGEGSWKFNGGNEVMAREIYHDDIPVYLYGTFSHIGKTGSLNGEIVVPGDEVKGKSAKAYITFPDNASTIEFRYAISYVSPEQARKNFDNEVKTVGFEDLKKAGEQVWAKTIGQIRVEGGTEAQKRSFYSSLYRTYERMVNISEDNQYYSGYDKKIHTSNRPFYVDDWTWDTYLAHHPLRVILNPAQEEDMLQSFVSMYEQSGWMPTFPVLFGDHACMNGFHSSVTLLDGYRKGLRNFDVAKAYEGMRKNAEQATMLPWRNGPKCELDDIYHTKGFFPALSPGEKETVKLVDAFEKRQAVAVTLGGSYDDWAVGQLAKDLDKDADFQKFNARATNYKNLWNDEKQMFIPKNSQGKWIKIDPKFDGGMGGRDFYDENNGWTYKWQVQHDIKGLIALTGGKKQFENSLDQLYREGLGRSKYEFWGKFPDATGLVGQYSMGNEPSFHIPYLYNFTDAPWKTQKRVRFLLDVWFKDNIFGIPGDEDGGGMTAFVVFSSMGFYPITPGLPVYTIGSPVFEKVTIDLPNGKQFNVLAKNCSVVNKYIQSAKMNGKTLNTPTFTHEELTSGGTLELEMGPLPNKSWGVGR